MGKRSPWLAACLTLLVSVLSPQGQRAEHKPATPVRLFPFREGGKAGKWGYINRHGKVLVPPRFIQALDFSDGRARVTTEKGLGYVDARGKVVFTRPDDLRIDWTLPFTEGLAAFSVKGKCGYFDRQGKVVVEPRYDDVKKFSEGLAAVNLGARSAGFPRPWVMRGGKWGFIDKTGRLVIPLKFGYVDKSAYIDKKGKVVLTPEYKSDDPKRFVSSANSFSEELARIDTSGRHSGYSTGYVGFIDKTGKFAIEPRLDGAGDFSEGLAAVLVGKKWGYMDRTGRIVVRPQFEEARKFSEGLAAVRTGEHWSYIEKRGKVVITGRFNEAKAFKGGLALMHEGGEFERTLDGPAYWSGGAWFYINQKGEKVRRYCKDDDHSVLDP
jgi:hypothetical protein